MLRRFYSAVAGDLSSKKVKIAEEFLSRAQSRGPLVQKQTIDGNQLQRFSQTLNRPDLYPGCSIMENPPAAGTPLPAGYHLAYFTPSALESELGKDGTDRSFNPDEPFTRRMWAGGKLTWVQENALKVGDVVTETTTVLSAEPKTTRTGEDMIVVSVEKVFENEKGVALKDNRNWLFRPEIVEPQPLAEKGEIKTFPEGPHVRDFYQTPVTLFRFSALTFNAHRIHYSKHWCRDVEGHRDLVVHGPLNLINMLDFWRDVRGKNVLEYPKSIKYRAQAPLYAEEKYRAVLEPGSDGSTQIKIWTEDGKQAMIGDITSP